MRPIQSIPAFLSLLLVASCKPGPGSSCDKGEARCIDRQNELVCDQGKFILAPCRGPRGCGLTPNGVSCDITANKHGDACSRDEEGASACTDTKTKITCTSGKFAATTCRGPKGCETQGGRPLCDTTVSEPGDACRDEDRGKACSVDGKQFLSCSGGKMTMQFQCLGPNGCKSAEGKLACDMSFARDKDPCSKEMEGKNACNLDHSSIVVCKGGKFEIDEECKKGTRCNAEGGLIRCEKPDKDGEKK
jgi:hypothetical protein